jgi:hypothetical protein
MDYVPELVPALPLAALLYLRSECSSRSVYARLMALQALDRDETAIQRPHRPAPRSSPKRFAMFEAAEPLSRSTGHPWPECPAAPNAMRLPDTLGR